MVFYHDTSGYPRIVAYLRLFRIFETFLLAATVGMALLLLQVEDLGVIGSTFFAVLLAAMGVDAINDVLDIKEDRINHPDRPIVLGIISPMHASISGIILILISVIIMYTISLLGLMLAIAGAIIGVLYSLFAKRYLLVKNSFVAITTGIFLILLPTIYAVEWTQLYTYVILGFVTMLFSYEIIKDIRDVRGDESVSYLTLPMLIGVKRSVILSYTLFLLSCLIIGFGFLLRGYLFEALVAGLTPIVLVFPFREVGKDGVDIERTADIARYAVIALIFISLGIVGWNLANRVGLL